MTLKFKVELIQEPDGGYIAHVPALPGCHTQGDSFDEVAHNRPLERHRINCAVLDYSNSEYSRYKVVNPAEAREHQEAIIHTENIHHRPISWPIVIRWRINGKVYTNGTGLGYLRKHHILPKYQGFYKEPIKKGKNMPNAGC